MTYEYCCGAVVYTMVGGVPHYLLIRELCQGPGCFNLPKGHMEHGETEEETALREVFEETGVRVELVEGFRAEEDYALPEPPDTRKHVTFFLGHYQDQAVTVQESEVSEYALVPIEEALKLCEYADSRQILREAHAFLTR